MDARASGVSGEVPPAQAAGLLLLRTSRSGPQGLAGRWAWGQFSGHPTSWAQLPVARDTHGSPCNRAHLRLQKRGRQVLGWARVEGDPEAPVVRPGSLGGPKWDPSAAASVGGEGWRSGAGTRPRFPALRRPPRARNGSGRGRDAGLRLHHPQALPPWLVTPKASGLRHERGLSPAAQKQLWSWGRVILGGLCRGLSRTGSGPTDQSWPTDVAGGRRLCSSVRTVSLADCEPSWEEPCTLAV